MIRTYLIVLSVKPDREDVVKFLGGHPNITHWFYSLPYSLFVKTDLTAYQLFDIIETKFGQNKIFITVISNSSEDRYGRMPQEHWELF
jgi:hypothetical protein